MVNSFLFLCFLLSNWNCVQIQNYKSKTCILKEENIRKIWKEFVNDAKYKKYF